MVENDRNKMETNRGTEFINQEGSSKIKATGIRDEFVQIGDLSRNGWKQSKVHTICMSND